MSEKECYNCNKVKSVDMFVRDPRTTSGTRNLCKFCFNKQRRDKTALKNKPEKDKLKMLNSLKIRECNTCNKIKPFESFVVNKLCSYNIEHLCLKCRNDRLEKWRLENPEKKIESDRSWRENNRSYKAELDKKYRQKNKEKRKESERKRRMVKRSQVNETSRQWYSKNKEEINRKQTQRKKDDIQYNLACKLRSRINTALKYKGVKKKLKTLDTLGCSFEELKTHIESQFTIGMSWDRLGRDGIHIDHIKPLAMYDLSNEDQLREACHYTNLQPLWQHDNLVKGARWIG